MIFEMLFLLGVVVYFNLFLDNFVYDFMLVEVYGGGQLVFLCVGIEVCVDIINGDDIGYIYVFFFNILNVMGMLEYRCINVIWVLFIYEDVMFVLLNGIVEI